MASSSLGCTRSAFSAPSSVNGVFVLGLHSQRILRSQQEPVEPLFHFGHRQPMLPGRSLTMTMRYAHLSPDFLRKEMEKTAGVVTASGDTHGSGEPEVVD